MTNRGINLPPEVVKHWPEIFKDVTLESVPTQYIDSIIVNFVDGKQWVVEINPEDDLEIDEVMEDFMEEYEDAIVNIEFRLNSEKVKEDITQLTKDFLSKRK